MHRIISNIDENFQKLRQAREKKFNQTILKLEQIYLGIYQKGEASWRDGFSAALEFTKAHVLTVEFHFVTLAITFVIFATGVFIDTSTNPPGLEPLIYLLSGLLAALLPMAISLALFPLHVKFRTNLWLLVAITILLSAILFSSLQPALDSFIAQRDILTFKDIFWKALVIYVMVTGYLQSRISRQVCINCFIKRHDIKSLLNYVPASKRGLLLSFSAQDHYVDIVTTKGHHLQRISMKEAVALVSEKQGLQVHRSHWVAFEAILALEMHSGRHFVALRNGTQIPVSKTKIKAIHAYLDSAEIGAELV